MRAKARRQAFWALAWEQVPALPVGASVKLSQEAVEPRPALLVALLPPKAQLPVLVEAGKHLAMEPKLPQAKRMSDETECQLQARRVV